MDTRFWGPSGWQLLHLVVHTSETPIPFLRAMKDALPCRFCRESTCEFMKKDPPHGDPEKWLYDFHNKVNAKLRGQCETDKRVICPPPDPPFEEVKAHYEMLSKEAPSAPPGMDFLFCIAFTYAPDRHEIYQEFFGTLADVYPYPPLRKIYREHLKHLSMESQRDIVRWMYSLMKELCAATGSERLLPSIKGVYRRYGYVKSSCNRGKTCRNGKRQRDHRKTFRVTHARLLR